MTTTAIKQEEHPEDAAIIAIAEIFGSPTLAIVSAWCSKFRFRIAERVSDHVIALNNALYTTMTHSEIAQATAPQCAPTNASASSTAAAERIFDIAMGIEPSRASQASCAPKVRCGICAELARHARTVGLQCTAQYLLLCPDCIIACCNGCAAPGADIAGYLIVHCAPMNMPPILNQSGKWSFDLIQRIKFDRTTLEGFITFRTFIVYNIALIHPAKGAGGFAPAASSDSPKTSGIFKLIRRQTKSADEHAALAPQASFIVRGRIKDGITLTVAQSFAEVLRVMSRPAQFDDDASRDLESAMMRIFAQEPALTYGSTIFAPPLNINVFQSAPQGAVFNYWRGWHWQSQAHAIPQGMPNCEASQCIAPIIAFISDIWCAGDSPYPSGGYGERVRLLISWFAHIIQCPGMPPERQLLFRGFARELVLPLLRFIGRSVIGAQYVDEVPNASAAFPCGMRCDCLLAIAENCAMKEVKPIMRNSRGLWARSKSTAGKASAASVRALGHLHREGPLAPALRAANSERVVEERALAPKAATLRVDEVPNNLLRVILCTAQQEQIPIAQERRRFGIVDYSRAKVPSALLDARMHQLEEAMACEGTAACFFWFLAQYQPLSLFWDA